MGPARHFTSTFGRVLTVVAAVAAVVVLVGVAASDGLAGLLHVGALPVLGALVVWALYWRPEVEVSDGGVTVVNPARTVHVPWPAFRGVDTEWSLVVRTNGRPVTAWAAPRSSGAARRLPGGRRRESRTGSSAEDVALAIVERHDALTRAGHLEGAQRLAAERGITATTSWHVATLVAAGALVALAVAGLVLG